MPDSRAEQIAAELERRLAAILSDGGVSYHLTPSKVIRRHDVSDECLDPSLETVYILTPDNEEEVEEATGTIRARLFMTLVLLHRFDPDSEAPYQMSQPIRWTWQSRMLRDVRKAIRVDITLGGALGVINTELTEADLSAENAWAERWAVVLVRLMVTYWYPADTP